MERELLEQINLWHEQDQFSLIIEHIERIPVSERDYNLIGQLARAYNNDTRYREAIKQLLSVEEQGVNDPLWQYRLGYAYCYIANYEQALLAFERANELQPHDESTLEFLSQIRPFAEKMRRDRQRHEENIAALEQSGTQNHLRAASGTYDPATFWVQSDYAQDNHVSEPFDEEEILTIEKELGYRLPASYIQLMNTQNGGIPALTVFPTKEATSWAEDHIAISSIMGIGHDKIYALAGELGSRFMIEDWGYPDLGIVICDCPSAGHDVVMLDYRFCGPEGEPCVVHVDQENDYEITYLAPNFEAFIRGLVDEDTYDLSDEENED
ncbi:SMI1/KNR4 family protein [Paenibacillus sp. W2I17]|uniref:SMI1/KNR4 family protein n=1 Tax=Paenibacillus sp. W2I17 TaxID=3042311 RepID=UPI00278296F9|nr:SMI1/KNR4 family protein [Paenibacillus sp. W2I17]MDQ0658883.1 tetratricopeptide (TPR) repeat protein [Paenibacillus sp. W2I17]